ncbi:MAG: hypothetical protein HQ453_08875 [Actinobacteria bacterium]|nr:hypothetical protein [Actinomycetota bacterium]
MGTSVSVWYRPDGRLSLSEACPQYVNLSALMVISRLSWLNGARMGRTPVPSMAKDVRLPSGRQFREASCRKALGR